MPDTAASPVPVVLHPSQEGAEQSCNTRAVLALLLGASLVA